MTETPLSNDNNGDGKPKPPCPRQELTSEAKLAIQLYMLKLVALPAIILAAGCFTLGFFIKDVAVQKAELKATGQINDTIQKATTDVNEAVRKTERETDRLASDVRDTRRKLENAQNEFDRFMSVLNNNPEKKKIFDALLKLDESPKRVAEELEPKVLAHFQIRLKDLDLKTERLSFPLISTNGAREPHFSHGKDDKGNDLYSFNVPDSGPGGQANWKHVEDQNGDIIEFKGDIVDVTVAPKSRFQEMLAIWGLEVRVDPKNNRRIQIAATGNKGVQGTITIEVTVKRKKGDNEP